MLRLRRRRPVPVEPPELLYFSSDPNEIPLVLPPWARGIPQIAAMLAEGERLHTRAHQAIHGPSEARGGRLADSLTGDLTGPNPYEEPR